MLTPYSEYTVSRADESVRKLGEACFAGNAALIDVHFDNCRLLGEDPRAALMSPVHVSGKGCKMAPSPLEAAAMGGRMAVIERAAGLTELTFRDLERCVSAAASWGRLDTVRKLFERMEVDRRTVDSVSIRLCMDGWHEELQIWIGEHGPPTDMSLAAIENLCVMGRRWAKRIISNSADPDIIDYYTKRCAGIDVISQWLKTFHA